MNDKSTNECDNIMRKYHLKARNARELSVALEEPCTKSNYLLYNFDWISSNRASCFIHWRKSLAVLILHALCATLEVSPCPLHLLGCLPIYFNLICSFGTQLERSTHQSIQHSSIYKFQQSAALPACSDWPHLGHWLRQCALGPNQSSAKTCHLFWCCIPPWLRNPD